MVAAATAVATLGTAAVKSAAEYEAQLANVSTLLTGTEAVDTKVACIKKPESGDHADSGFSKRKLWVRPDQTCQRAGSAV